MQTLGTSHTQIKKEIIYILKIILIKKTLLNHLINRVEELENICHNKYFFKKYYEGFLNSSKCQKSRKKEH